MFDLVVKRSRLTKGHYLNNLSITRVPIATYQVTKLSFQWFQEKKGLRALRPFFGPHLRSKYESGNKRISLHDLIRPIFLVFHFGFSLDLAVH